MAYVAQSIWNTECDIIFPSKLSCRDFTLLGIIVIAVIKAKSREKSQQLLSFNCCQKAS